MPRKIYYIPMVHTGEELGWLGKKVTQIQKRIFGEEQTAVFLKSAEEYWELVEIKIKFQAQLFRSEIVNKVHIFVDGLPNGREDLVQKTVDELVAQGKIPAYQIIRELKAAGARVYGTESSEWLIKEFTYWKKIAAGKRTCDPKFEKELLENRDEAIIARVHERVPDGEIAIVFIGRAHNVVGPLSQPPYNFEVINL